MNTSVLEIVLPVNGRKSFATSKGFMQRSEIIVTNLHTRPVSFSAKCPDCGHTEEAHSNATVKKDNAEMERVARMMAVGKIVRHLKDKHGIDVV